MGRQAGVKFFRFNAGLAAILLAIALAFRPATVRLTPDAHGVAFACLILAAAALTVYWATLGRSLVRIRGVLVGTWIASGLAVLLAQALSLSGPTAWGALTAASFVTSGALLGGACTSMILGHWYLVLPSMDVALLQAVVRFHIVSVIARTVVIGVVVAASLGAWGAYAGPDFARYVLSIDGVFFWQRVLFGLAGPLVLAYLTWETAKIRSTQSATGILYVDVFAVVVGEVLAKYLLLTTQLPL